MTAADQVHRRREGCVHRAFRGDVLVVDDLDRQLRLTGASSLVWIGLDRPGTLHDVHGRLVDAGMAPDVVAHPVLAGGLRLLVEEGLVEAVPTGTDRDRRSDLDPAGEGSGP